MYNLSVCCPQEKETWTGYHKNIKTIKNVIYVYNIIPRDGDYLLCL